jgi:hypothetical protein
MQFRYRFVPYGTRFVAAAGERRESGGPSQGRELFENELAADVGGACWGHAGQSLAVLDHHFYRDAGQFPSAAAAVLHNAARVRERFAGRYETMWLVTHRDADFDAYASLYLARSVIAGDLPAEDWEGLGLRPEGWHASRNEIDWFRPQTVHVPADRRWAVLIAAEASRVDNCRLPQCPAQGTLHAVLYAALQRGRDYRSESSGACEFFDEVRLWLSRPEGPQLDPFFDSVLEGNACFAPELALLAREREAYERDLRRGRRLIVFLPESTVPFADWYPSVAKEPLLDANDRLQAVQIRPPHQVRRAVDGIFLRDPQSLLFKEWARNDVDNSSLGRGFLFTAIAYSRGRQEASENQSDYYFALDPERAGLLHLYPAWARLEEAEIGAIRSPSQAPLRERLDATTAHAAAEGKSTCRLHFEQRAARYAAYFDDPWWDGSSYDGTIVCTPSRGTLLGPAGVRGDLGDDPVAQIVEQELTDPIFGPEVMLLEWSTAAADDSDPKPVSFASLRDVPRASLHGYRFLRVGLDDGVDLVAGQLAAQIGAQLWRHLDPENKFGLPADFEQRLLVRTNDWIAVWSRRGIVVGYKSSARARVDRLQQGFVEICRVVRQMHDLMLQMRSADPSPSRTVERSEAILFELVGLQQKLAVPESAVLQRFFESSRLDEVLGMLRDLNMAAAERVEIEKTRQLSEEQRRIAASMHENVGHLVSLQQKVEYVEIGIVFVYTAELLNIFRESLELDGSFAAFGILGFSVLAALLTAIGLQPWKHHEGPTHSILSWKLAIRVALLVGGLAAFLWLTPRMERLKHAEEGATKQTAPSSAAGHE